MMIRKATGEEMLALWGYQNEHTATPTARFFYRNILSGNAVFWTLDNAGKLIGELYAFFDLEDKEFADGKTVAYLCAFRVKQEYRSLGLGRELMEAVLADLKRMGFKRATIGVDDVRNEELYGRMGFSTRIKVCYFDPCAVDENMRPECVEAGYRLLSKEF